MAGELIGLVLPLSLDTFAVAAALGSGGLARRDRLRVSVLFAGFEAGMPLIGLALGAPLASAVGAAAQYLAVGVLIVVGLMMLSGDHDRPASQLVASAHGWRMLGLGLSVSLDELAIGFTLGLLRAPVVLVIVLIGAQAVLASQLGLRLGRRLAESFREGAERMAGLVLLGLAAALLAERLAG